MTPYLKEYVYLHGMTMNIPRLLAKHSLYTKWKQHGINTQTKKTMHTEAHHKLIVQKKINCKDFCWFQLRALPPMRHTHIILQKKKNHFNQNSTEFLNFSPIVVDEK